MSNIKFLIILALSSLLSLNLSCDKGKLTEEEQKTFKGCVDAGLLSKDEAIKYLRMLLKGSPDTIDYYTAYEKQKDKTFYIDRVSLYQLDICTVTRALASMNGSIHVINGKRYRITKTKNGQSVEMLSDKDIEDIRESYNLTLKVIEKKKEYTRARICAIKALSLYSEIDKRGLKILNKLLSDDDLMIRLESADILLHYGKGDIALPVVKELVNDKDKIISERARLILEKIKKT